MGDDSSDSDSLGDYSGVKKSMDKDGGSNIDQGEDGEEEEDDILFKDSDSDNEEEELKDVVEGPVLEKLGGFLKEGEVKKEEDNNDDSDDNDEDTNKLSFDPNFNSKIAQGLNNSNSNNDHSKTEDHIFDIASNSIHPPKSKYSSHSVTTNSLSKDLSSSNSSSIPKSRFLSTRLLNESIIESYSTMFEDFIKKIYEIEVISMERD